jgi:predicted flap endonuclease-1-like 5' DNA nuclease
MADEEKVQPEAEEAKAEAKKSEPPPPRFKITNVVRRVNTRVRRAVAPGRRRFKQFVCGRRLLRKQSILVTPEEMEKHKDRLYEQVREGAIEITAPDGSVLSADTLGRLVARKGMEVHVVEEAKVPVFSEKPGPAKEGEEPKAEKKAEESSPPPVEEPEPEPEPAPEPPAPTESDDLTELPGVGAGRARKLESAGITTFKQIAEMAPESLAKVLGSPVTEDQAAAICDAASEKEEG